MRLVQPKNYVRRLLSAFLPVAFWCGISARAAANTPELVLKGHEGETLCVAFSPDGKTIATGGTDGKVRLWEVATAKETAAFDAGPAHAVGPVRTLTVAFAAKGKLLLASTEWHLYPPKLADGPENLRGGVQAWDLESKELKYSIERFWGPFLAVTPNGKTFAIDNNGAPKNFDITLHDVETGKKIGELANRDSIVTALSFSPDGRQLAVGTIVSIGGRGDRLTPGSNRSIFMELWDVAGQKLLASFKEPPRGWGYEVAFSPDGKTLAACVDGGDGLKLFDLEDLDKIVLRDDSKLACNVGGRGCLKYSPDGKILASAIGGVDKESGPTTWGYIWLLKPWSGKPIRFVGSNCRGKFRCIAFSPDGKLLATAGNEEKVKLWKIEDE